MQYTIRHAAMFLCWSFFDNTVYLHGGIRLCDSLEFVTSERVENSLKIKHANFITDHSLTDYFDKRTVSMIFFFNLCHDNDCQSHSN